MNNAVTRPSKRLLKRALMGSAASSLVLSIIAGPAFAEDLSFPSLPPAFLSQPLDGPKPPPVPLAVFGDTMPDPGHLTISVIPQFGEGAHQMMGTRNIIEGRAASAAPAKHTRHAPTIRVLGVWRHPRASAGTGGGLAGGIRGRFL